MVLHRTLGLTGRVQLQSVIVSAVGGREFAVQDPGGGEYSGIYVWTGGGFAFLNSLNVGDTVTVDAYVGSFFDNLQLEAGPSVIEVVVESSGNEPVPTQLATTHSDWEPYEGVLVQISGSTMSAGVPNHNGISTLNVTGLGLGDTLHQTASGSYTSITGIVFDGMGGHQLLPRDSSDLVVE